MEYADKNLCIGDCKPPAPRYGHKSKSSSRKWDTAAHRHILLQTSQIVHIYTLTYYSTAPEKQNTGLFSLFLVYQSSYQQDWLDMVTGVTGQKHADLAC